MPEKEQKDLLEEQKDLKDKVKSLEKNICALAAFITSFIASTAVYLYDCNNKQNEREEELRKIICDIHKDTNTPAPKYDFKANKFVTGGYKYDPNLVKKLQELCNKTH